jgi:hypothetical protein
MPSSFLKPTDVVAAVGGRDLSSLRLAVRQKADCGGIHESHILQVKSDLRVAALHLPAQFQEIFLSLPAAAGS